MRGLPLWSVSVNGPPTGSRFHITTSINSAAERWGGSCAVNSQPPAATAMPPAKPNARRRVLTVRYALKVRRLPVEVWMTLSGIWARASSMKLSPLQCIGMSTSGSSFLISAITCLM